jgi:hypothetical protein
MPRSGAEELNIRKLVALIIWLIALGVFVHVASWPALGPWAVMCICRLVLED